MTVAELFAQLQAAMQAGHGPLEVVVRAVDDEVSDYCGTIGTAQIETPEAGPSFFAIDCGPEESDDWDGGGEEEETTAEELEADETDEAELAEEEEPDTKH